VLTWLKDIIRDNLLFDERNPAMIVGDAPLEAALRREESASEQHPQCGDTATDDGGGEARPLESGHAGRRNDTSGRSTHQLPSRGSNGGDLNQCSEGQGN
jgi:hypothetical protein